jgi:hypothetical protein
MPPIKLGTPVRQIVPAPIEGVVVDKQFVKETDTFQYMVASPDSDGDGEPQTRWFEEHQIEAIEPPADAGAPGAAAPATPGAAA